MSFHVHQFSRFEAVAIEEAARLVAEAATANATKLSLAGLRISALPTGLAKLSSLRELDLAGCARLADFEPLADMGSLEVLGLTGCKGLRNLDPIGSLRSLRVLDLTECRQLCDLRPLTGLSELQSLHLRLCVEVRDLSPLSSLYRLEGLDLSGCEELHDASPLEPLGELRHLSLRDWWQLSDLGPLTALGRLKSLNLSRCGNLRDLSPLAVLAALQSLDLRASKGFRDLGPLASLVGLRSLNVCWCDDLRDVSALASLTHLESLGLSGSEELADLRPLFALNELQSLELGGRPNLDLRFLEAMPNLQTLDLDECKSLGDLTPLASLTQLQNLELFRCHELRDLAFAKLLGELQTLNLSDCNQLVDFRPLSSLAKLRTLNLSSCRELCDLQPLGELTSLRSLQLDSCSAVQDLEPLKSLANLVELSLAGCEAIRDLTPLAGLHRLHYLQLGGCTGVHSISPLAALSGLSTLYLPGCKAVVDIEPLASLTELRELSLDGCSGITDLRPLWHLRQLESVKVRGLTLDCRPNEGFLSNRSVLSKLFADRLEGAPAELASTHPYDSCLERLEQWQTDLSESGAVPNSEVKVLVLGNGGVGKTQICRRLRGEDYDESVPSTHGIQLGRFEVAHARGGEPATFANLWDFGGQDMYLGTHALFLDQRAVYLIVWSPSHENDDEITEYGLTMRNRRLGYWLEYVRSLAGELAPVIVVQTRCDGQADMRDAPVPHHHGLTRLQRASCSALNGDLDRLWYELRDAVRFLRHRYAQVLLPASWVSVSDSLRAMSPRRTMSLVEFHHLCKEVHGAAVPSVVLDFLHRSSRVFWRESGFGGAVVLDQAWALAGVYAVLNRNGILKVILDRGGLFSAELLDYLVWGPAGYSADDQRLFLSLMLQCNACFKVADGQYIATELLPPQWHEQRRLDAVWRGAEPDARVRLCYAFLHEGMWRAVLCAVGERAGVDAVFWRDGVCFHDIDSATTTRLWRKVDSGDSLRQGGSIGIEVAGPNALPLARHMVESITRIQVGRIAAQVHWERGVEAPDAGNGIWGGPSEGSYPPFAKVPVAGSRQRPNSRPQVALSYAWRGESEALVDKLEQVLDASGFDVYRDRRKLRAGDWIMPFMQEIGRSRCVLLVLSARYLKSPYCVYELLLLHRSALDDKREFLQRVVPLVLRDAPIGDAAYRLRVAKFWERQWRKLNPGAGGQLSISKLRSATRHEQMIIEFALKAPGILEWLADVCMPQGSDLIEADDFATVMDLVRRSALRRDLQVGL